MRVAGIRLRKTRGQNLLADPNICRRIVQALHIGPQDAVLEIGPGLGALTCELITQAHYVAALEIEPAFCELLRHWYGADIQQNKSLPLIGGGQGGGENVEQSRGHLEIIQADVLAMDLTSLFSHLRARTGEGGYVRVISNLPYYITTPILTRLLEGKLGFARMVLTMQKEVAERITAGPGGRKCSSLSLWTQYYCKTKLEFKIPAGAFYPSPRVESAVVSFVPWEKPPVLVLDEPLFFALLRAAFSTRRKTLRNSLKRFFGKLGLGQQQAEGVFDRCGIDARRRAETLSLSEFARLANLLVQAGG